MARNTSRNAWLGVSIVLLTVILPFTAFAQDEAVTNLRMQALRATAAEPSVYELSFYAADTLATDAEFVLDFPAAFELEQLHLASSMQIKGGFEVVREHQTAIVRRFGLGPSIPPGQRLTIRLGVIGNPEKLNATHEIGIRLRTSAKAELSEKTKVRVEFHQPTNS